MGWCGSGSTPVLGRGSSLIVIGIEHLGRSVSVSEGNSQGICALCEVVCKDQDLRVSPFCRGHGSHEIYHHDLPGPTGV